MLSLEKLDYKLLLNSDKFLQQRKFWEEKLSESFEMNNIFSKRRIINQDVQIDSLEFSKINSELLTKFCNNNNLSVYIYIVTVINVILKYYFSEDIVSILSPLYSPNNDSSGRINDIVILNNRIYASESIKDTLVKVNQTVKQAYKNQDFPIYEILNNKEELKNDFQSIKILCRLENLHSIVEPELLKNKICFDFKLEQNELIGKVNYNANVFNSDLLKNFIGHITNGLNSFLNHLNTTLNNLEILDQKELNFYQNNSSIIFGKKSTSTIIKLFEEQVNTNKDAIALTFEDTQITYYELNNKANNLAFRLINEGANSNMVVALYLESSIEIIIGILSVLKSGAAFLPIDINIPPKRLSKIINDVIPEILLSNKDIDIDFQFEGKRLNINCVDSNRIENNCTLPEINPENLAYVIFTSGSTGIPKGVLIDHKSIYNSIKWRCDQYQLSNKDVVLQLFNYAFDGFLTSIFTPLVSGSKIVLLSENTSKHPQLISDTIVNQQVTHFICVPSLYTLILERLNERTHEINSLQKVTLAGEKINKHLVEDSIKFKPTLSLINEYGPTENSVVSTFCTEVTKIKDGCIGRPIRGTNALILNEYKKVLPPNIPSNLYLVGEGLSRGYLNNPELTSEKFIINACGNKRLYKSGDFAYWDKGGEIYFINRSDKQVKINGNRIELGEIESLLSQYAEIEECIAIKTINNKNDVIGVFYTSKINIPNAKLAAHLSEFLPYYMIPQYFVKLETFPLNSFAKIDYSRLGTILQNYINKATDKVNPSNETEKIILDIWKNVLLNNELGVTDNFFSFGGNSTKAIQVSSELNSLGYKVSIKDIFKFPTVGELSVNIKKSTIEIEQITVTGDIPLTPGQRKFFYTNTSKLNSSTSYLLSFHDNVDEFQVEAIFKYLHFHHDGLRIVFEENTNKVLKQINNGADFPLSLKTYVYSDEKSGLEIMNIAIKKIEEEQIELLKGPLMKLVLFKLPKETKLLISIHQLIIDNKSWEILFEDLNTLLNQSVNIANLELPQKTSSFQNWANALIKHKESAEYHSSREYWREYDKKEFISIFNNEYKASNSTRNIKKNSFRIEGDKTGNLLINANKAYSTHIEELVISSLLLALNNIFGSTNARIDIQKNDRGTFQDLIFERTIGLFSYFFPFSIDWKNCNDIKGLIVNVKEHLRRIPNKEIDYGIYKYLDSDQNQNDKVEEIVSTISFSYIKEPELNNKNQNFQILSVDKGCSISGNRNGDYPLEIIASVRDQELIIEYLYCKELFENDMIIDLAKAFNESIKTVLNHCIECPGKTLTPVDFTYKDLEIEYVDELQEKYSVEDIYTLSPLQEGMLYHSLLDTNSSTYFQQQIYTVKGSVNHDKVKQTLNEIILSYDVLRTQFIYEGLKRPVQLVKIDSEIQYTFLDVREEIKNCDKNEFINKYLIKDREKSFNLSSDNLMRIAMLQTDVDEYEFIWSFHHILMDSWCLNLINKEFLTSYCTKLKNETYNIPKPIQYKEYIKWLEKKNITLAKNYWKEYLKLFNSPTGIVKRSLSSINTHAENTSLEFKLSDAVYEKVKEICAESKVTTSMFFHAIWGVLLAKYNDESDVLFGTVVSGRPSELSGLNSIVGLFINTIPIRFSGMLEKNFISLLSETTENILECESYSYISMADIRSYSGINNAIFDHIFIFESANVGRDDSLKWTKEYIEFSNPRDFQKTNYDLNIIVTDRQSITFKVKYNSSLYEEFIINRIQDDINTIIDQITSNPNIPIEKINLVSPDEKQSLLYQFNKINYVNSNYKPIIRMIEDMVQLHSDKIAVIDGDNCLSYKELDDSANKLAKMINLLGCQKNDFIPILYDRSLELFITILGILKSGAAYVPVDCSWPIDRIKEILKDIKPKFVLTNKKEFIEKVNEFEIHFISKEPVLENVEWTPVYISENDPIYAIYTSGSTGIPRGTVNLNKGISNRFLYQNKRYKPKADDTILLTSNHAFDASVWQLFWPLTLGLKVVIPKQKSLFDLDVIVDTISKERITMTDFVPSVFNVLVESFDQDPQIINKLDSLRQLQVGGEAISPYHTYKFKNLFKNTSITNIYGPTEASIGTIFYEIPEEPIENIPIGNPIDNVIAFVLDKNKKLCPIGISGELYLGGICVGSGYLNNAERTNDVFVPINENELNGEIFYRTGDMARVMQDGNIEFLGRLDSQVKIRGLRIELAEIENRILKNDKIKEAVVIANTKNNRTILNAFYTANAEITSDELRDFLFKSLLEQMIPQKFILVNKIPLTPNGKIDKHKLNLLLEEEKDKSVIEIPNSEVEKVIYRIWSKVLDKENIAVNDNFFDLGGNSLDLVRLDGFLKAEINFEESLMKLVQYPTIRSFSKYIESIQDENSDDKNINRNNLEEDILKKRRQDRRGKKIKKHRIGE